MFAALYGRTQRLDEPAGAANHSGGRPDAVLQLCGLRQRQQRQPQPIFRGAGIPGLQGPAAEQPPLHGRHWLGRQFGLDHAAASGSLRSRGPFGLGPLHACRTVRGRGQPVQQSGSGSILGKQGRAAEQLGKSGRNRGL